MSGLKTQRTSIRRAFTRTYKELQDQLATAEDDGIKTGLWKRLEDRFNQLTKIDEEIMQELREREVSQEEMDEEYEAMQDYRDKWNDLYAKEFPVEDQISPQERDGNESSNQQGSSISSVSSNSCSGSRYKLPKLKLVEFNGNPKDWLNFWSQFKGIHEDERMTPEEKFQYLIQATETESIARRVVNSFPPTATNYEKAIEHLKSRFGKPKVLVELYVRNLLKLVLTNQGGKQKLSLASLYDQLATQLRALESLGVTSDNFAAMLYPLVESALSEEVLITWERIRNQRNLNVEDDNDQLRELMTFLQGEVESNIRISMAKRGVDPEDDLEGTPKKKRLFDVVTTTDLLTQSEINKCIFCGKAHASQACFNTSKLSLKERFSKIRKEGKCFKCLKGLHLARNCKAFVKCSECGGNHFKIICTKNEQPLREINAHSAYDEFDVILQTLVLNVHGPLKKQAARTLIDSGSGRSYISSPAVKNFGLKPVGKIELVHSLFGGLMTKVRQHSIYVVNVSNIDNTFRGHYRLIEVEKICGPISPTPDGPWLIELKEQGIQLSDEMKKECPIHILFGANITSKLYTGNIYETESGPVAFETRYGWTLMGTSFDERNETNTVLLIHANYITAASIHDLWNLDIIGIHDPIQEKSKEEMVKSTLIHFENNLTRMKDGRYMVALPWIKDHPPVSVNKEIAERRLHSSIAKLKGLNKLEQYQKVFDEWLTLGIIEEVTENHDEKSVSFLPHHPVFNEKSLTTPIRPVFDASAKSKGYPALNDCLEKGQNLLNDIPTLLILFRMKLYGAISDITKAFLQIGIKEEDRKYLRFLWYKDGKIITFQHCRVVFGITSSPFLLAATLNHHLNNVPEQLQGTAKLLNRSLYVDNCVVSVDTKEERDSFIKESTDICASAKFELRGWIWNKGEAIVGDISGVGSPECGLEIGNNTSQETLTSVLGLLWNVQTDTLSLDVKKISRLEDTIVTKRTILAATHHVFDPIGFAAPSVIVPKMLLQELCKKKKIKWDTPVPEDIKRKFLSWKNSLHILSTLSIPRWIGSTSGTKKSLHIFTDASQKAYTAVAFLRCEVEDEVCVQLLLAKSRVATIKPMTTPRLELVACECGAKMANFLKHTDSMTDTLVYFWSDSGNALSWIKRQENWQVFVYNRVKTINQFTNPDDWRHIPGHLNPADLPSRGCTNKQLLESKWWEGPEWLKRSEEFWPRSPICCDEKTVMSEKKKMNFSHSHLVQEIESLTYFKRFSSLRKIIRMIAWMKRWRTYKRKQSPLGDLTTLEENEAEKCLWRMVQKDSFTETDKILAQLNAKKDESGIWRLETKLLMRNDTEGFRRPILLPKDHLASIRLVQAKHLELNHCGAQTLRCALRENFWIINSRVIVRQVTTACKRCIRFSAKHVTAPEPALPKNRVRDATPFEVVGIDLGGPLYLSDEDKVWFVIYTCAVYRAVHLELVSSLSTPCFIESLRRFIARRGRPEVIYSDHGLNFVGTENLMNKLNWEEIILQSDARKIKWIFNPPAAPWWGGWWERLVALVKQLLRKRLGRDLLSFEEMTTVLCDCEQLLNTRPLTYISEDPHELMAVTPMMFLNEAKSNDVIDLDKIESTAFGEKFIHRQEIRQELRERFRKEYLSLLLNQNVKKSGHQDIKVGDVVIMEQENKKRVDWPLARVIQVFPGQDGVIRSVRLRLAKNGKVTELDRPIQRIYMLEAALDEVNSMMEPCKIEDNVEKEIEIEKVGDLPSNVQVTSSLKENINSSAKEHQTPSESKTNQAKLTRSGRKVNRPERLSYQ